MDELADAAPFDVGREGERGAGDEETHEREDLVEQLRPTAKPRVGRSRLQSSSRKPGYRSRRLGLFIGGVVLAVVLAADVIYSILRSESSVAAPPIVTADATRAEVQVNAPADDKTKPAAPGASKVAAEVDDAAPLGDHPAASPALASDARRGVHPVSSLPARLYRNLLLSPTERPAPLRKSRRDRRERMPQSNSTPDSRAAPSGGAFVQVSSQKSERAAKSTYRGLQVKFPAIFGKLDPNIQRADFGDKSIHYRVRVGPFALADAKKICGSFKAAGGDCLIAGPDIGKRPADARH